MTRKIFQKPIGNTKIWIEGSTLGEEGAKMELKIPVEDEETGESFEPKRSVVKEEELDCFLPSMSLNIWNFFTRKFKKLRKIVEEVEEERGLVAYKGNPPSRSPEKTETADNFPKKKTEKVSELWIWDKGSRGKTNDDTWFWSVMMMMMWERRSKGRESKEEEKNQNETVASKKIK